MYLGSWKIDDLLTFSVNTHDPTAEGCPAADADSVPSYRVYEDETGTPILTGSMAKLDDANTLGFYSEQITLSAANGFEKGKSYNIRIQATVNSITGVATRTLQIEAEVDANVVSGAVPSVTGAVGSVTGAVGSVTGAVGSVTGNVGGNVTGSVGSVASGGISAASFAANAITAAKLDPDVTTELQAGLPTASALGTVGSVVDAIKAVTDLLPDAGALTSLATAAELAKVPKSDGAATWNATALASIQSEANDALVANHLDHLLAATYDPASKPGAADALLNEIVENDGGVSRFTANALEQAPTGGSAPTASEIADAVWDEDLTGHTTPDSAGDILGNVATGTPPTAAAIADAVWDEAQADHVGAGSFGVIASEIADILVDTGTTLQGELDGIQADTEDIQTRLPAALVSGRMASDAVAISGSTTAADNVEANIGNLDAAVSTRSTVTTAQVNAEADQALADVGLTTTITGRIDAAVSTRSTLTQAQVATELSDALTVDVVADSIPADGSRPTIAQALYMVTQYLTERSVSGTTVTVKKPDGSTTLYTLSLDDASTPTSTTRNS